MTNLNKNNPQNCPVCGTPCKIVGKTTMHYEPLQLDEDKIADLICIGIKGFSAGGLHSLKSASEEIAHAIVSKFGKPNTEALELDLLGHQQSLAILRDNLGLDPNGESYQKLPEIDKLKQFLDERYPDIKIEDTIHKAIEVITLLRQRRL